MRIVFDRELTRLDAYAEGVAEIEGILDGSVADDGERVHLVTHEHPVLVTDPWRIGNLPPAQRDVVSAFFGLPRRTIEYDGVALDFDATRFPRVWSPSIDTLLVCKALGRVLDETREGAALLEVGCGSGFIALHAMEALRRRGRRASEVHLVDIEPQALQVAMGALEAVAGPTLVTTSLGRRDDALRVRGRYDLVVTNPPYIRRPADLARGAFKDNAYEGVALLRELAEEGAALLNPGGSLVIVMSSLCDSIARPWFEPGWEVETLAALDVPLKVYAVTSGLTKKSRAWLDFLRDAEGLTVHDPPRDGYATWQRIEILRCRPRA
jgi:methylase of polypeptide subunit release factors